MRKVWKPSCWRARHSKLDKSQQILNKTGQTVAMPDALGFYLVSAHVALLKALFLAMGLPQKQMPRKQSLSEG